MRMFMSCLMYQQHVGFALIRDTLKEYEEKKGSRGGDGATDPMLDATTRTGSAASATAETALRSTPPYVCRVCCCVRGCDLLLPHAHVPDTSVPIFHAQHSPSSSYGGGRSSFYDNQRGGGGGYGGRGYGEWEPASRWTGVLTLLHASGAANGITKPCSRMACDAMRHGATRCGYDTM